MPAVFDQSKNDCLKYCRHSTASQRSTRRGQTVSKRFYPKNRILSITSPE